MARAGSWSAFVAGAVALLGLLGLLVEVSSPTAIPAGFPGGRVGAIITILVVVAVVGHACRRARRNAQAAARWSVDIEAAARPDPGWPAGGVPPYTQPPSYPPPPAGSPRSGYWPPPPGLPPSGPPPSGPPPSGLPVSGNGPPPFGQQMVPPPAWFPGSPTRRQPSGASLVMFAGLAGLIAVIFGLLSVGTVRAAYKSYQVQHHGHRVTGTVASERSFPGGRGSQPQVDLVVQLPTSPVGPELVSVTIEGSNQEPVATGGNLVVLVDRSHPTYAELPGKPDQTVRNAVTPIGLAVVMAAVCVGLLVAAFRRGRGRPGP